MTPDAKLVSSVDTNLQHDFVSDEIIAAATRGNGKYADATNEKRLTVHVSGRIYPPADDSQPRGGRKVGGMAIAVSCLSNSSSAILRSLFEEGFLPQLLGYRECQMDTKRDGLVALLGYNNLGPSRRRCSLYGIFFALKLVNQLYITHGKHAKTQVSSAKNGETFSKLPTHIEIVTDSNYVYELLKNTTRVQEWGNVTNFKDFQYTGHGPKWFANTDILYSLSRAYYNMVDQQGALATAGYGNVTIGFVLNSRGATPVEAFEFRSKMNKWGSEAAEIFQERA